MAQMIQAILTLSKLAKKVIAMSGTVLKKHTMASATLPVIARPERAFGSSWRFRHTS